MGFIETIYEIVYPVINNMMLAALTILIGIAIGRLGGKFVARMLENFRFNELIKHLFRIRIPAAEASEYIIKYACYIIFLLIAINQIGASTWVGYTVGLMLLAGIIISIILAFKDLLPNLIAGVVLHRKYKQGDKIEMNGITGTVTKKTITDTTILTGDGDKIVIPNDNLLEKGLIIKKNPKKN